MRTSHKSNSNPSLNPQLHVQCTQTPRKTQVVLYQLLLKDARARNAGPAGSQQKLTRAEAFHHSALTYLNHECTARRPIYLLPSTILPPVTTPVEKRRLLFESRFPFVSVDRGWPWEVTKHFTVSCSELTPTLPVLQQGANKSALTSLTQRNLTVLVTS